MLTAVASGAMGRALSAAVTLVSLPLAVRYLGPERYGVWATITTTAVWINLLDIGISNSLTNEVSKAFAHDDRVAAARSFTNALALTVGFALTAGMVFAVLLPHIDWARLLNVTASVRGEEVRDTVVCAVALMLLALPCNLVNKVLSGYQELHRSNFVACAAAVAGLCGLAAGVVLRVSMPVLFVMSTGCLPLATFILLVWTVTCQKPWLLPRLALLDRNSTRGLLKSGAAFFLIQVAAVVVYSSDNLVVSHYLGAAEVTPYSVTWRLVGFVALLQSLLFPAFWPAYAEAYARRDYAWIRRTFAITMAGTLLLNLACMATLMGFGRSVIGIWAGPAAVPGYSLMLAMCIWAIIGGFMTVESCLLAALNRTRVQAVLSIVAAGVNIALSLIWVRQYGALGVIGGTIVSYLVVLVVPQSLIVRSVWTELTADTECAASYTAAPLVVPPLPNASSTSIAQE